MARNVEHIVDAAHHPVVAIFILPCTVAREVTAFDLTEVDILIPLVVAVKRAEHRRPGLLHHQQPPLIRPQVVPPAR